MTDHNNKRHLVGKTFSFFLTFLDADALKSYIDKVRTGNTDAKAPVFPRVVWCFSDFAFSRAASIHSKGRAPAPLKKLVAFLQDRVDWIGVREAYSTQSHANCGQRTLKESFKRITEAQSLNNRGIKCRNGYKECWVQGLKWCFACLRLVARDVNASMVQMAIVLKAFEKGRHESSNATTTNTATIPTSTSTATSSGSSSMQKQVKPKLN